MNPDSYSAIALPPHAYVPGRQPHPDEEHLATHGLPPLPLSRCHWKENPHFLYGIDLFNHSYHWECHEALEKIWLPEKNRKYRNLVQGIILGAAALLKQGMGQSGSASRLLASATHKLQVLPAKICGVQTGVFIDELRQVLGSTQAPQMTITLDMRQP